MSCPSCGAPAPEGARFCASCGRPLFQQADERRVVTVVFADLVGYTSLSETLDPERVKGLVDRCFARLATDVTGFGGRVDKVVGDAMVALFGAPVAHEDDAERAVRAALRLHASAAEVGAEHGIDLRLRVGVNTGEVLVGALATGDDYTAMGDVVNVAQRLQTEARPGQVVVGEPTRDATDGAIQYEPLGKVKVKGRDVALRAWLATGTQALPGQRVRRTATPVVGRDRELRLLEGIVDVAVHRSRAHMVLLVGEAGVGKRRLVDEVVGRAHTAHGALVLTGRCLPYGEASVLWPIAEMIRTACTSPIAPPAGAEPAHDDELARFDAAIGFHDPDLGDAISDVARIAEGLAALLGGGEAADDETTRKRAEAVRVLARFLGELARERPVLLVATDLHWADELLLRLMREIMDRLRREPIVAFGTGRPSLLERWRPGATLNVSTLALDPLDPPATRQLLDALIGAHPGPEVEQLLVERSGGNPLFLEEHVALLEERGALVPGSASDEVGHHLPLPDSLRGLVAARLDVLAERERALLADAAVVGRSGEVAAVEALARSRGASEIGATIRVLADRDLLTLSHHPSGREGTFDFRSDVIRDVAYGNLTKAERARRHAWLAAWLHDQDGEEQLDRVAVQYGTAAELVRAIGPVDGVAADVEDRALAALRGAADRAGERGLHLQRVRLLSQALALEVGEGPARWRLLLDRAAARTALRDLARARADVEKVLAAGRDDGAPDVRARATTVLGELEQKEGDVRAAVRTLSEAVELWRELDQPDGVAEALRLLGMTHLFAGRLDDADEAIHDALTLFTSLGDRRGEAWALQNLAWTAFMRGRMEVAEERLDAARERFAALGDDAGIGFVHGLLGFVRFYEGDLDEAERLADRVAELAEEAGDRWATAITHVLYGVIALWRGHTQRAVEHALEAVERFEELGDAWAQMQAGVAAARALVSAGRVREGLDALKRARSLARATRNEGMQATVAQFSASIALMLGDAPRLQRDLAAIERLRADRGEGANAEARVLAALGAAFEGAADQATDQLETLLDELDGAPPTAFATASLALAAAVAGRAETVDRAVAALDGLAGATYLDHAFAVLGRAGAAAQRGRPHDAVELLEQLAEAVTGVEDVVARGVVDLAAAHARAAAGLDGQPDVDAAREHLADVGVTARGWDRLIRGALGGGLGKDLGGGLGKDLGQA